MSKLKDTFFKVSFFVFVFLVLGTSSCSEKTEMERLRAYLGGVQAQDTQVSSAEGNGGHLGVPMASADTKIINGTPRVVKEGVCGDGIINGPTEDCDQGAIQNTNCRDYGAHSGTVRCQPNCLYDISNCITPAVDKLIGGTAETCRCNCDSSSCSGGCNATALTGQSACKFDCENSCVCQCEGKLNAHIEECKFLCVCAVADTGNPDCDCTLNECDFVTTISPNIGTLVNNGTLIERNAVH